MVVHADRRYEKGKQNLRSIMNTLVTGVNGQLGHDVCRVLDSRGIENLGVGRAEFDLADAREVRNYILSCRPATVIHCAAYTAVDKAEDEPELCMSVNAGGAENIARACREIDAKMMFISTDYVFPGEGERFYEVDDPTGPLGVYGASKLAGEIAVRKLVEKHFIVRTSWVFGRNGKNFIKTMLQLSETRGEVSVVCDQIGSPTYTADLAPLLCDMAGTEKYGTYHATNEGICSWADFAFEIFNYSGCNVRINYIPSLDYPSRAKRPFNSRLSKKSLDDSGFIRFPVWTDALKRYLDEEKT